MPRMTMRTRSPAVGGRTRSPAVGGRGGSALVDGDVLLGRSRGSGSGAARPGTARPGAAGRRGGACRGRSLRGAALHPGSAWAPTAVAVVLTRPGHVPAVDAVRIAALGSDPAAAPAEVVVVLAVLGPPADVERFHDLGRGLVVGPRPCWRPAGWRRRCCLSPGRPARRLPAPNWCRQRGRRGGRSGAGGFARPDPR